MALGSRLKAVDQKLHEKIAARAALANVQVVRGDPLDNIEHESIWIDRLWMPDERPVTFGQQKLDPTVVAEIWVKVKQQGDAAPALRDRAWDLLDEVSEAVRLNGNLDGEVLTLMSTSATQFDYGESEGRVCAIRFDVTYYARKG